MEYQNHSTRELEHYRLKIFERLLPVICIMAILGTLGVVGNIVAILFYTRKCKRNTTVTLISFLAVMDTCVCILIIPNIVEMAVNISNDQRVVCKVVHAIGIGLGGSSIFSLMLIAIDRHRRICLPFKAQLTQQSVKRTIIGIPLFSFCVGFRNLFTFDTIPVEVKLDSGETLNGTYCTSSDHSDYKIVSAVFNSIDFIMVLGVWVCLIICYSLIIVRVVKYRKKLNRYAKQNAWKTEVGMATPGKKLQSLPETENSLGARCSDNNTKETDVGTTVTKDGVKLKSTSHSTADSVDLANLNENIIELNDSVSKEALSISDTFESDNEAKTQQSKPNQTSKTWFKQCSKNSSGISSREQRLAFMMLAVSIVFFLCFLPYFAIRIVARFFLNSGEEFELGLLNQIALRLPHLNSIFNPFIYLFFNGKLRAFVWTPIDICLLKIRAVFMHS